MGAIKDEDFGEKLNERLRETTGGTYGLPQTKERVKKNARDYPRSKPSMHLIDALFPPWRDEAERLHQITVDPHTPIYHALCTERSFYPHDTYIMA